MLLKIRDPTLSRSRFPLSKLDELLMSLTKTIEKSYTAMKMIFKNSFFFFKTSYWKQKAEQIPKFHISRLTILSTAPRIHFH